MHRFLVAQFRCARLGELRASDPSAGSSTHYCSDHLTSRIAELAPMHREHYVSGRNNPCELLRQCSCSRYAAAAQSAMVRKHKNICAQVFTRLKQVLKSKLSQIAGR